MTEEGSTQTATPPEIYLIALFFMMIGIGSLTNIVLAALEGNVNFDFGALLLFLPSPLLRGDERARGWAVVLTAIIFVGVSLATILLLYIAAGQLSDYNYLQLISYLLLIVLLLLFSSWSFIVLRSTQIRSWFDHIGGKMRHNKRFLYGSLLLVSLTIIPTRIMFEAQSMEHQQQMRDIFYFNLTISAKDSETNLFLNKLSFSHEAIFTNKNTFRNPITTTTRTTGDSRQLVKTYKGIAYKPFEITIGSDGYKDKKLRIDRDTPDEVTVSLEKVTISKDSTFDKTKNK